MRTLIVADSLLWLKAQKIIHNVCTGICDLDETDYSIEDYLIFFKKIVTLIFKKLDHSGYAVFIQTDRKYNKSWIDKSAMITEIALNLGYKVIWHKIILNRDVGKIDLYRPTYSHMLCYSYSGTTGIPFCDVIPISQRLYKNGTPILPAELAIKFIKKYYPHEIVDPFVGRGTIPALCIKNDINSVGIDIDPEQIEYAKELIL